MSKINDRRVDAELALAAQAVAMIRMKLFEKYEPIEYFIVDGSEQIIEPYRPYPGAPIQTFGGLEFRLFHPDLKKLSVLHHQQNDFVVSMAVRHLCTLITQCVVTMSYEDLSWRVLRILIVSERL